MPILARAGAAAAKGFGMLGKIAAAVDEYFEYVTLLLHGNGTNGAQNNTFLDSSTNNFTITRNGNTTQGTFTPYGSNWSNYFDGTGDYLSFTKQTTTSAFTCECWFYRGEDVSGYHIVFSGNNLGSVNADNAQLSVSNAGAVGLTLAGTAVIAQTGTAVIKNQWNHIAWVRSGTSCAIFVNGSRIATGTSSSALNIVSVGTYLSGYEPNGYVSNARINTTAVYDPSLTTCTVPTAPLTAITGTYLLTCQSNRFVDNSASPLTITVNGNPSVQRFSPFNPTTPYAAGTIGGSGYFDGTGDYLGDIGTTSSFNFLHNTTALFTFECWVYIPSTAAEQYLFDNTNGTSSQIGCSISIVAGGALSLFITRGVTGVGNVTAYVTSTGTVPTNQWVHIAVTYDQSLSSNNAKFYINGAAAGSGNKTGNTPSSSNASNTLRIGTFGAGAGAFITGYISNLRISNSIVYSSAFTPPTTPVTGGALLLNFTNGGIIDNAMMNDLETVGNAQISTSVSKFGGGSLAFDGNGDYLTIPPTQQLNFGSGNFTFEFWAYLNTTSGSQAVWHTSNFAGDTPGGVYIRVVSGAIEFAASTDDTFGTRVMVTSSTSLSATTWTHVACVRNGNTLTIYINGTSSGSATFSGSAFWSSTYYTRIGYWRDGDIQYLNAYLDDLRITKGYARYTANFTPPTAPFPDQ